MTEKNKFQRGDRVRIVAGVWASDCGVVEKVTEHFIRIRVDTGGLTAIVKPRDLERIE